MYMKDWIQKLDEFLALSGKDPLTHAETISAEIAKQKAYCEYDKYRKRIQYELSPVEIHFIESFENEVKHLKKYVARLERARNSYAPPTTTPSVLPNLQSGSSCSLDGKGC